VGLAPIRLQDEEPTLSVQETALSFLEKAGDSNQPISLAESGGRLQFGADGSISLSIRGASEDHLPIKFYDPSSSYLTAIDTSTRANYGLIPQTTTISLGPDGTVRFDGLALKASDQSALSGTLEGMSAGMGSTYGVVGTYTSESLNWHAINTRTNYSMPAVSTSCGSGSSLLVDSEGLVRPCLQTSATVIDPTSQTDPK
jgi:hypothetical protein